VENGKQKYEFMFDIKTPLRNYYLAADSYEEMSIWVRMVCNACGLKGEQDDANQQEEETDNGEETTTFPEILSWLHS
jgi:hypothetical protein